MGFDQSSGAMGVGGGVRLGQRLRFMVRDREGAKQDLMDHALSLKRRQLQARVSDHKPAHLSGAVYAFVWFRLRNLPK